jgi:stress response protein YsnF
MNFQANLVNYLGCVIGHIKCQTNAEGTETIKREWLPVLEPGDSIVIVSVIED